MSMLRLKIISLHGAEDEIECDSVHFIIPSDSNGKGAGSMGIRQGHENALIALAEGPVEAFISGNRIHEENISGGFAIVKDNLVTIVEKRENS